jgi:hypothetical protein
MADGADVRFLRSAAVRLRHSKDFIIKDLQTITVKLYIQEPETTEINCEII